MPVPVPSTAVRTTVKTYICSVVGAVCACSGGDNPEWPSHLRHTIRALRAAHAVRNPLFCILILSSAINWDRPASQVLPHISPRAATEKACLPLWHFTGRRHEPLSRVSRACHRSHIPFIHFLHLIHSLVTVETVASSAFVAVAGPMAR